MVQTLGRISDFMLSKILPGATAAGCCPPDTFYRCVLSSNIWASCFFAGKWQYQRCSDNCNCVNTCTNVACCVPGS